MSNNPQAIEHAAKRMARLAAVQALYQIELTQRSVKDVLGHFKRFPAELMQDIGGENQDNTTPPDFNLMGQIVNGVATEQTAIDELIAGALSARLSADRLELLLRSILRCGAFELMRHGDIPANIVVNDYIDVTHAYFDGKEPGLVNGILDKLAKNLHG